MIDVFLMGTVGDSAWRAPILAACAKLGITCFDPTVDEWDAAAGAREADALQAARVIVMAITPETASLGALAESGWAALSALQRGQAFGLYVAPDVKRGIRRHKSTVERTEDASLRARALVNGHARQLQAQFPALRFFLADSLEALQAWAIEIAPTLRDPR